MWVLVCWSTTVPAKQSDTTTYTHYQLSNGLLFTFSQMHYNFSLLLSVCLFLSNTASSSPPPSSATLSSRSLSTAAFKCESERERERKREKESGKEDLCWSAAAGRRLYDGWLNVREKERKRKYRYWWRYGSNSRSVVQQWQCKCRTATQIYWRRFYSRRTDHMQENKAVVAYPKRETEKTRKWKQKAQAH